MEFKRIKQEINYLEGLEVTDNQTSGDRLLLAELKQALQLLQTGVSGSTLSIEEVQVIITSLILYKKKSDNKTAGCKVVDTLLPKLADVVVAYYR